MKYLIDDDLRDRLLTILTVTERWNTRDQISELKPIEPLTFDELNAIYKASPATQTSTPSMSVLLFARAIEAHILGDKHDS